MNILANMNKIPRTAVAIKNQKVRTRLQKKVTFWFSVTVFYIVVLENLVVYDHHLGEKSNIESHDKVEGFTISINKDGLLIDAKNKFYVASNEK